MSMLAKAEESLVRARREAEERIQFSEVNYDVCYAAPLKKLIGECEVPIFKDVRSLSEQLQNEKATVSRAVAQNRELKDQLIELQDKPFLVFTLVAGYLLQINAEIFKKQVVGGDCVRMDFFSEMDCDVLQLSIASTTSIDQRDEAVVQAEEARIHAERELTHITMQLKQIRADHRRVTQENEELRSIFVYSAHMPGIAEKPLAWTELEAHFARVMSQNADLIEQNERLEHVIVQLQSENDTIGLW
uniref:Golgin subfamily A conserved domain-containing protein n=1 Tax=Parascaris equorum TaxID=6256 RepID=A0A914RDH3_PAREQ